MDNIFAAVTSQNEAALAGLLEGGWRPPNVKHRFAGLVPDYSAWTEVLLRDWIKGLELLDQYHPNITLSPEVWDIALRNSSLECIKFLWDKNGFDPQMLTDDEKKRWTLSLIAGMGETWSAPHEIKDILPCCKFLASKGFDLHYTVSGEFEPGDFRMAGHSLFTRAVFLRKWDLVEEFWPSSSQQWYRWPRLNEVLFHLLNVVTGDYKQLMGDKREDCFPEEDVFFKWLEDFDLEWLEANTSVSFLEGTLHEKNDNEEHSMPIVSKEDISVEITQNNQDQQSQAPEDKDDLFSERVMFEIVEHASPVVLEGVFETFEDTANVSEYIPLYRLLSRPSQEKIAPWLRLPLMLQSARRQKVWNTWEEVLNQDPELSWLHELAMYPDDDDVKKIILMARHDSAIAFHRFWARRSASGFSPHERWINMGGDEKLVQAWVPQL